MLSINIDFFSLYCEQSQKSLIALHFFMAF